MIKAMNQLELSRFLEPVSGELAMVENEFSSLIGNMGIDYIKDMMDDIGSAPLRFLRAGIVLLAAKALQQDPSDMADARVIHLAAIMEIIFYAVFVHNRIDDRYGKSTVPSGIEDKIAVLAGDSLYTRAFYEAAKNLPAEMLPAISGLTMDMCLAEIKEEVLGGPSISGEKYLEVVEEKTAVFFSMCCRLGGMLVSGAEQEIEALEAAGLSLGMLYQISSDLMEGHPGSVECADSEIADSYAADARSSVRRLKQESVYSGALLELADHFLALVRAQAMPKEAVRQFCQV